MLTITCLLKSLWITREDRFLVLEYLFWVNQFLALIVTDPQGRDLAVTSTIYEGLPRKLNVAKEALERSEALRSHLRDRVRTVVGFPPSEAWADSVRPSRTLVAQLEQLQSDFAARTSVQADDRTIEGLPSRSSPPEPRAMDEDSNARRSSANARARGQRPRRASLLCRRFPCSAPSDPDVADSVAASVRCRTEPRPTRPVDQPGLASASHRCHHLDALGRDSPISSATCATARCVACCRSPWTRRRSWRTRATGSRRRGCRGGRWSSWTGGRRFRRGALATLPGADLPRRR